ncbi:hypothetical protein [Cronobacter sakazakii]|uniref:hypothetical protein n=1 Tax=Cronobacter sakazakii TaxID=28141 RepID=UPI001EFEBD4C|nr:hypothetical protein [Cronobacter sakazakii]
MLPEMKDPLKNGLQFLILMFIPPINIIFMETGTCGGGLPPLFAMVSLLFFNIFLWGLIIRLMRIWSCYKLIKGSVYYFCFLVIIIFSDVGYYSGCLAWPGLAWPGLAWPGLAWPGLVSCKPLFFREKVYRN